MQGALVYRWTGHPGGREKAAHELLREFSDFLDTAIAAELISDYAWYVSLQGDPHVMVIRGDASKLVELTTLPEVVAIHARASLVNKDFHWGYYATGDAVGQMVELWEQEGHKVRGIRAESHALAG